jgi:hypothetical protein
MKTESACSKYNAFAQSLPEAFLMSKIRLCLATHILACQSSYQYDLLPGGCQDVSMVSDWKVKRL